MAAFRISGQSKFWFVFFLSLIMVPMQSPNDRQRSPIFVMGCHRSGTNLLYDVLLSAGGFAIYRGLIPIYNMLIPRFGSFANRGNREKIVATWLRSKGFRRAEISSEQLLARVRNDCRTGGDFICAVMDAVAKSQQMERWALYSPGNVLHIERIKRDIPNALFLHIIRDGRDIALSLKKMGGFAPLPWDRSQTDSLVATALYWEWMVRPPVRNKFFLSWRRSARTNKPSGSLEKAVDARRDCCH
jgi:hypothetical protein